MWGGREHFILKDERGDLFLPGLHLAISKQPCLRGKPFSYSAHYCILYSAVLGFAGHRSTLQSCQALYDECALCLSVHVCVSGLREGGLCREPGALRLDRHTPGLEARAQVHHCRQWKALQKAIGLSMYLASAMWAVPQNSALIQHRICAFAHAHLLPTLCTILPLPMCMPQQGTDYVCFLVLFLRL